MRIAVTLPFLILPFWALALASGPGAEAATPDELALGLSKLHWSMSPRDVTAAYPAMTPNTAHPGIFPRTNLVTLYLDDYPYAGCTFEGVLRFDDGGLRSVELSLMKPNGPDLPCRQQIETEFRRQYGVEIAQHDANKVPDRTQSWYPFKGFYGQYRGPVTGAHYEATLRGIEISFNDLADPPPPMTIYNVQTFPPPNPARH